MLEIYPSGDLWPLVSAKSRGVFPHDVTLPPVVTEACIAREAYLRQGILPQGSIVDGIHRSNHTALLAMEVVTEASVADAADVATALFLVLCRLLCIVNITYR